MRRIFIITCIQKYEKIVKVLFLLNLKRLFFFDNYNNKVTLHTPQ